MKVNMEDMAVRKELLTRFISILLVCAILSVCGCKGRGYAPVVTEAAELTSAPTSTASTEAPSPTAPASAETASPTSAPTASPATINGRAAYWSRHDEMTAATRKLLYEGVLNTGDLCYYDDIVWFSVEDDALRAYAGVTRDAPYEYAYCIGEYPRELGETAKDRLTEIGRTHGMGWEMSRVEFLEGFIGENLYRIHYKG